ncbi:hypothetical protein AB6809_29995 [Paraburkholderia sp. RCC_158]|uniref:hypothetical protein n=1 Tax=Paraburkholderia sp. RCC_158 TaxID=3239220 RepID=UPI003525DFCA
MNYQQTLKADGSVEPNCVIAISDNGDRRVTWSNTSDPLWVAYLNSLAAGNSPLSPYSGPLEETIRALSEKVDARVANVYAAWTRFQQEYLMREQAAAAYKAAGYAGDVSPWISSFATPAKLSNQDAADRILAQADGLNGALEQIGAQRMRKYEIQGALTAQAAQAVYEDILIQIDKIAATLG